MEERGLIISYKDGINSVFTSKMRHVSDHPAGELLCRIFQGETLYNIGRILRNCISECPMADDPVSQDTITGAEYYIIKALEYEDYYPARLIAQGSFIRCMDRYRALDSESLIETWYQERERARTKQMPFTDIGFDTIGSFLRLCFNNYYIDLHNAVNLFSAMAAVRSGTATSDEKDHFKELLISLGNWEITPGIEMQTIPDPDTGGFCYRFVIRSFLAMTVFEFTHIEESAMKLIRCQNPACGKYFTAKRSSAKYCGFEAPQAPGHTCSAYYPQFMHRTKLQENDLDHLIKNAASRLYMDKKRHPEEATEISPLISELLIKAPLKKEAVMKKTMTKKEFTDWLDTLRRQKGTIYE